MPHPPDRDGPPSVPLTDPIVDSRLAPSPPPEPLQPLEAGQIVGEYRLLDPVGAGGFSMVWRAEHVRTLAIVALKLPRVHDLISHLRREAEIRSLVRDEQVVDILEVHLDHDPPFLVMPFVKGRDLKTPDKAPAPRNIVDAFRTFLHVARVVARLHRSGIVHGDLKPGNVRFTPDGACVLLDLGLARHHVAVRQTSTLRASVVSVTGEKIAGTLDYMPPEVLSGRKPDASADVYALGVILHTLLCGKPPAFGVSPADLNPYLPAGTTDFLRQMLDADPDRRIPSADAVIAPVESFIRAEERCLSRRNGHERRVVFHRRMKTLVRGLRALGVVGLLVLLGLYGVPQIPTEVLGCWISLLFPLAFIGMLLGMTTLNAWAAGVPEKTYKNRSGHPWWTFMMQ